MKWPWVSRLAFEVVREERNRLRAQCDSLVDQIVRIQRTRSGMREEPRKERVGMEPMPAELKKYVRGFASTAIQKTQSDQLLLRRRAGESWEDIAADIEEPPIDPMGAVLFNPNGVGHEDED